MGIAIKMHQEKYNLKWHTFSDHLRNMLHEMMKSNELTDVTLVCDDKIHIKAHKIVLSACSPVFKDILNDLPQNNSVIYLRGIHHQEMESILEFIYLGVATFHQERMNEFLTVAKSLEIKEISKNVEKEPDNNEIFAEFTNIQNTKMNIESYESQKCEALGAYDENINAFQNKVAEDVSVVSSDNILEETTFESHTKDMAKETNTSSIDEKINALQYKVAEDFSGPSDNILRYTNIESHSKDMAKESNTS